MSFQEDLTAYVQAGFPGILVRTSEWVRLENDVMGVASSIKTEDGKNYNYRRWTMTRGWTTHPDGEKANVLSPPKGLATDVQFTVLDNKEKLNINTIYLIHGFPEMFRDPSTRQALRETLITAKSMSKTLILCGMIDLPSDLEKDFTVLDYDFPSRPELSAAVKQLCKEYKIKINFDVEQAAEAASGLTALEAENAFALSLVRKKTIDAEVILREKKKIVKKSGLLEVLDTPKDGFASIGGLANLKSFIEERRLANTPEAIEFGLEPPKGVLIVGIPGCGKSLCAKVIASVMKQPLIRLDIGRMFSGLVGSSENNLRDALRIAEAVSPCVLFIDEFEKSTAGMNGASADGGTTQRVVATLLSWMQDHTAPVFVAATANSIDIPPEMVRKGRWDEVFGVDLPNELERVEIAKVHLLKRGRGKLAAVESNLREIAFATEHFTGAEIEESVKSGLWKAFNNGKRELIVQDITDAAAETIPLSSTMTDKLETFRKEWLGVDGMPGRIRRASPLLVKETKKGRREIQL